MRTVLVGAVDSTRVALSTLAEGGEAPLALVTLPRARASRHSDFVDLRPTAARYGIEVIEAVDVNAPDILERLRTLAPEVLLVIGWSQIIRDDLMNLPSSGSIGYHPAKLPLNRGRAAIPWTILQGTDVTASSLFWIDAGTDTGDLIAQHDIPVAADETAETLYAKHMAAIEAMLRDLLPRWQPDKLPRLPQEHSRATYCARRTADDGHINWLAPASDVWRLIRAAGRPYPGAFTFSRDRKLVIWSADLVGASPYWGLPGQVQAFDDEGALVTCGDGKLVRLREVQIEGEEPVQAQLAFRVHEKLGLDLLAIWRATKG